MKFCTHCKHAEWQHTAAGRLHPSGYGTCEKAVTIPAAYQWFPRSQLSGGRINRRDELSYDCPYFEWSGK